MNDFKMKISPAYEYLNFTKEDMSNILAKLVILLNSNNYIFTSNIVIKSIECLNSTAKDYICTINYKSELFERSTIHVYESWIRDFIVIKKRDIKIQKIIIDE